ncbi:MAG TPA: ATP-binding protein [Hyphomicrobiaceae bacterium]|nr:ATP-binding protein [Hyphomicrobiaceae bacterium]
MQRIAWQRWLEIRRRVSEDLEPLLVRLWARRAELGLVLGLVVLFMAGGGLSPRAALLGLAVAGIWAALWPLHNETAREVGVSTFPQRASDSDELWRMIVDAVPEPALALDHAGYVLHGNRLAEDLFGSRRRGGHVASMSRDPELLEAVDRALASGQACSVELHERVPVERRLLATVAPLDEAPQARAQGPALLLSFRDLSEQDRLTRMRADFVANASHELRTPLASLRGFVETLQGAARDDTAARERFLKVMGEQAERMTRLVDDLLSLSRVEMREHLPPAERVDLNEAVAHVIQSLQPIAGQTGTTIDFQGLGQPAVIRGDSDEIVQVFQNLVQNAIKYGKPGGRITVRLVREPAGGGRPARFVASVTDDGPGIAPQHLPRLTERFYRVSVVASREKGGTGLGLAIVKHILNRHRGQLDITSTVGRGSTFSVTLPAQD